MQIAGQTFLGFHVTMSISPILTPCRGVVTPSPQQARPEKTTDELPTSLKVFLFDKGIQTAPQTLVRVFCSCCDELPEQDRHETARRSHDKRMFLAYRLGTFPNTIWIAPKSRGRDAQSYYVIERGGVLCDAGHFCGICAGKPYSVSDPSRFTMQNATARVMATLAELSLRSEMALCPAPCPAPG